MTKQMGEFMADKQDEVTAKSLGEPKSLSAVQSIPVKTWHRVYKVRPKFPVQAVPPVDSISEFNQTERREYGIVTSTGMGNAYRIAFALGQGASRKDVTFDKAQGIHTCCGSKVAWRHKTNCDLLRFDDE